MPAEALVESPTGAEVRESALCFSCDGAVLPAILSHADGDTPITEVAVLIIVGGPQYRVGSHRQFVQLARALARSGISAMRFDYRGMGDADGAVRDFEGAGADVLAAIEALRQALPRAYRIVLWGLCDAASLALMHGATHPDVAGFVLANPWVRSPASMATATVKHYYRARLMQADLWRKILCGGFDWRASWLSARANLQQMLGRRRIANEEATDFRTRMARGLAAFRGPVLLLLSGEDLTAREFLGYTASVSGWKALLGSSRLQRIDLRGADHTFSRREWKAQVEQATIAWIRGSVCAR